MPAPPVEPTPLPFDEFRRFAPELAQEASYFAASARISNLRCKSIVQMNTKRNSAGRKTLFSNVRAANRDDRPENHSVSVSIR